MLFRGIDASEANPVLRVRPVQDRQGIAISDGHDAPSERFGEDRKSGQAKNSDDSKAFQWMPWATSTIFCTRRRHASLMVIPIRFSGGK